MKSVTPEVDAQSTATSGDATASVQLVGTHPSYFNPPSQVATPPFGNGGGGFPSPGSGNGVPGGLTNGHGNVTVGTLESVDGNTVTVRTPNGDTVTVKVGDSTRIQVSKAGSVSGLASEDSVVVAGSRDGKTVTATSITEGGFGGGFPGSAG